MLNEISRYKAIFHNALIGFFRIRLSDGMVLEANPHMAKTYGFKNSDEFVLNYKMAENWVDPKDQERMHICLQQNGELNAFEAQFYRKDKMPVWVRFSAILDIDEGVLEGVGIDITEQRQAEQELKTSHDELEKQIEARTMALARANLDLLAAQEKLEEANKELLGGNAQLQAVFDTSPAVLMFVDDQGIIRLVNQSASRLFGVKKNQIIDTPLMDFADKVKKCFQNSDELIKLIIHLDKVPDQRDRLDFTKMFKRSLPAAPPQTGLFAIGSFQVLDQQTREIGRLWTFNEISHLKRADEQVHAMIQASPVPMIISRMEDGTVLYANEQLASLVGLTASRLIGRPTPDFYANPEDRTRLLERLEKDGLVTEFEVPIKKDDGSLVWMIFSVTTTQIAGERVILGGFHDISKRKLAEEQLKLYRQIYDNSNDGIVIMDTEGCVIEKNQAHKTLSGYNDEDLIGKTVSPFMGDEQYGMFIHDLKKYGTYRGEFKGRRKDGSSIDIDMSAFSILDEDDEAINYINIVRDITAQKKVERVLEKRLRYEEGLAACSTTLLTWADTEDDLPVALKHLLRVAEVSRVYISENFIDEKDGLCFRRSHEVLADGVENSPNPQLLQHFPYKDGLTSWQKKLSSGKVVSGGLELLADIKCPLFKDQKLFSVLAIPITVDEKWFGFLGFEDIWKQKEWSDGDIRSIRTASDMIGSYIESKRTDEALRISEERFRNLVENANDIIYSMTTQGTFTYLSPRVTEIMGYQVEELINQPFFQLLHADDREPSRNWFATGLKEETRQGNYQFRMVHKDGSIRWFATNSSVLRDDKGDVIEVMGVARDVTDLKMALQKVNQANKQLNETQSQLLQSEKMASLGMLVAGIAHEINTPMGAVNSMHNTSVRAMDKLKIELKQVCKTDPSKDPLVKKNLLIIDEANRVIENATERVTALVRRLRSFARLDEAELQEVDVHEGVEDTLTLIHHEIKHDITVVKEYGDIPRLTCFPGQLNQVFLNLFINAKQAISGKGKLIIRSRVKDEKIEIEIEDSGSGIPGDKLDQIFDPGFTTKGRGVGTGLGLSICYQIIQQHRGELKVKSSVGIGTTFTIILPMDLEEQLEKERLTNDNEQTKDSE